MSEKLKKPIVLCIMDGWGINKNSENTLNVIAINHLMATESVKQ